MPESLIEMYHTIKDKEKISLLTQSIAVHCSIADLD
jgi:hypothetical protein